MNVKSTVLFIVATVVLGACSGDPYGNGIIFNTQQAQERVDKKKALLVNKEAKLAQLEESVKKNQERLNELKANSGDENAAEIAELKAKIAEERRQIRILSGSR